MTYTDEEYLLISGLQHFLFCRRQWGLIHIENQWVENFYTVDGGIMHERAHDEATSEKRGDTIITRGMDIFSHSLGVVGKCDVLEFHRDAGGIPLSHREGKWRPFPVEYKRGQPKTGSLDEAQLCCQALCLEEMLCIDIPRGALFYGETRRRLEVEFDSALRSVVVSALTEMRDLYRRGHTPRAKPSKACNACSLKELCLPKLVKVKSAAQYMAQRMEDTQ